MALKVGGLFAGYGGLELGLSQMLDCEPAWFSELDAAPSKILAHHWPDVPNLGDVTKIDWAAVEPVDIITGGSPCQDLSHAGKRAGMKAGTRSGLWASMCDAIDIIRPSLVVWENVRGALSAGADSAVEPCPFCVGDEPGTTLRALGRVLGDLAELGYDAWWTGLRAADVGAAHGRFRIFVFATPADAGPLSWGARAGDGAGSGAAPIAGEAGDARGHRVLRADGATDRVVLLPTPDAGNFNDGQSVEAYVARKDRERAKGYNGNGGGTPLAMVAQLLPTPTTTRRGPDAGLAEQDGSGPNLHNAVQSLLPTPRATDGTKGGPNQRGSSGDLMLPSAVQKMLPTPAVADVQGGRKGRSGARSEELLLNGIAASQDWREYEAAIRRQEAAFGRLAPLPTELGAKGQPRLSPRFVEWLMGLPEGWVTDVPGISRNDQLKALGNGVVPQQCAAAARLFLSDRAYGFEVWS